MDDVTRSNSLYIILNQTKEEQDHDYQSNQYEDWEMEWAKLNGTKVLIRTTTHESMPNNVV